MAKIRPIDRISHHWHCLPAKKRGPSRQKANAMIWLLVGLLVLHRQHTGVDASSTAYPAGRASARSQATAPAVWRETLAEAAMAHAAPQRMVRWFTYKNTPKKRRLLRRENFTTPTYGAESARQAFRYFGWYAAVGLWV